MSAPHSIRPYQHRQRQGFPKITEFISSAENLLAVGDAWDEMHPEARSAILMLTGNAWVGSSGRWSEIPAKTRIEVAHQVYFFRDFLQAVLP